MPLKIACFNEATCKEIRSGFGGFEIAHQPTAQLVIGRLGNISKRIAHQFCHRFQLSPKRGNLCLKLRNSIIRHFKYVSFERSLHW